MTIPEVIEELERLSEVAKQQGFDPSDVEVNFVQHSDGVKYPVNLIEFERDRDGIADVFLRTE